MKIEGIRPLFFSIYIMKSGSVVSYKYFYNIKKTRDIGIILETQFDFLLMKEVVGFTYEDLVRIYWFTMGSEKRVPFYKTDFLKRKWYLRNEMYMIKREMDNGNF